jgi:hypothetical protein
VKRAILLSFLAFLLVQELVSQTFISSTYLGFRSRNQLVAQFQNPLFKNGIRMYKITYYTPDVQGDNSVASGLMVVPDNLAKVYPLLCYQHGTSSSDIDVPSKLNGESDLPVVFGGMGYVAVAPDYLGLGDSPGFHPYVHAATEASAGADMLRAGREFAAMQNVHLNEQVFVTGYSQGGHGAMALHRLLETQLSDEFGTTAAAPMSGPYSISGVMRELILQEEPYFYPAYLPNTILSYQTAYGNIYQNLDEVFKPAYLGKIQDYYDGVITLIQLNDLLIDLLIANEGASVPIKMLQDDLVQAVLTDPNHPFNLSLADNDVYDWAPTAPTRLFYCTADDQVPFRNSVVADSVMNENGAADLQAIDVNPNANHGGCVSPAVLNTLFFFANYQQITDVTSTTFLAESPVEVFPNPATDLLKINGLHSEARLRLLNLGGRQRLSFTLLPGTNEVHLSGLEAGVYFLEITTERGVWTERVAVVR